MAGYGMTDPKAAAAINKMAAANNKTNTAIGYKPTTTTQKEAAARSSAINYVNNAAKYMPSVNPKAQTTSKTVTNQSAGNDDAKRAMLAWGGAFMQPGAQLTGSAANQFTAQNALLKDTSTGSTWRAYQPGGQFYDLLNGGGSSGGSSLGGGGLGGLASAFGGGGMGGLGSLGGLMGGGGMGGMGGIGDALGGALGGGAGGVPAEEKEPEKPAPVRHWAGAYTDTQLAQLNQLGGGDLGKQAQLKAAYDRENLDRFAGMESYEDTKKKRTEQARELAGRQGGQYDTEGNYYSPDVARDAQKAENEKRSKLDWNMYDTPKGAVPIAGTSTDNTSKSGSGSGGGSSSGGKGGLDSDWLKKLAGMASSWFGGG
jgi:hypothetical protein